MGGWWAQFQACSLWGLLTLSVHRYSLGASLVAQMVKIHLQCRRPGFNPWVGKIPWRREWYPLQYSGLENSMDRGAWQATVHGFTRVRHNLATKQPSLCQTLCSVLWTVNKTCQSETYCSVRGSCPSDPFLTTERLLKTYEGGWAGEAKQSKND